MSDIDTVVVEFHHAAPGNPDQDIAVYSVFFTEMPPSEPAFEITYYVAGYKNDTPDTVTFTQSKLSDIKYSLETVKTGYIGDICIVVSWKDSYTDKSGKVHSVKRIRDCILPAGCEINKPILDQQDHPPQLFAAIKAGAEIPSPDTPSTITGEVVEKVINDIYNRLNGGIGPAWENGGYENQLTPGTNSSQLEECWAQHIATMLSGSPYYGTGYAYGQGEKSWKVFSLYLDDDPAYPIAHACEHLCNMALLSRVEYTEAEWIGARGASSCFQKMAKKFASKGCKYISDPSYKNISNAVRGDGNTWSLRPASMYSYENPGFAHVAFIERVFSNSQNAQFLDTSGMGSYNGDDETKPVTSNSGRIIDGNRSGIMEYSFIKHAKNNYASSAISTHHDYKGLFISPTLTIDELQKACNKMSIARPLALARLVLLERNNSAESISNETKQQVLWASPLLPLWEVHTIKKIQEDNTVQEVTIAKPFGISLLLWSIRNHLYHEQIEARWQIDIPRGKLFDEMKDKKKSFLWQNYDSNKPLSSGQLFKLLEIGSKKNGHVQYISLSYQEYNSTTGKTIDKTKGPARTDWFIPLPVGGRNIDVLSSSEFTGKKTVDNTKIPQYFRGPQAT